MPHWHQPTSNCFYALYFFLDVGRFLLNLYGYWDMFSKNQLGFADHETHFQGQHMLHCAEEIFSLEYYFQLPYRSVSKNVLGVYDKVYRVAFMIKCTL